MKNLLAAITVLLPFIANAADNPTDLKGYGKTTWGMTVAQVQAVEPQGILADKTKLGKGYTDVLVINELSVVGMTFSLRYGFKENKLADVSLNKNIDDVYCHDTEFTLLERKLSEKYGASTVRTLNRGGGDATWKLNGTIITLHFYSIGSLGNCHSSYFIIYDPTGTGTDGL